MAQIYYLSFCGSGVQEPSWKRIRFHTHPGHWQDSSLCNYRLQPLALAGAQPLESTWSPLSPGLPSMAAYLNKPTRAVPRMTQNHHTEATSNVPYCVGEKAAARRLPTHSGEGTVDTKAWTAG